MKRFLLAISFLLLLVSCKKENITNPPNPLTGKWKLTRIYIEFYRNGELEYTVDPYFHVHSYLFRANNTGEFRYEDEVGEFNYSYTKGKLVLTAKNGIPASLRNTEWTVSNVTAKELVLEKELSLIYQTYTTKTVDRYYYTKISE